MDLVAGVVAGVASLRFEKEIQLSVNSRLPGTATIDSVDVTFSQVQTPSGGGTPIPEPATLGLFAIGMAGIARARRALIVRY